MEFDGTWHIYEMEMWDEYDPASGSGWIKMKENDVIEGIIKFHMGDVSGFSARRFK